MTRPTWMRFDSVLGRSVLMLIVVLTVTQILNLIVLATFVFLPQVQRISSLMAQNVAAITKTVNELTPEQQTVFLARLSDTPYLQFHKDGEPPAGGTAFPNFLETAFMQALESKLKDDPRFSWRRDGDGRLWISLSLNQQKYWVAAAPPATFRPEWAILTGTTVVLLVALAGGAAVQGRIARPITKLAQAAANVSLTSTPQTLSLSSMREIRDLAESFNRMTARLADAEHDRQIMLAGVSHDLRTPLAKIRLAAEMIEAKDGDLRATIARQVESMDAMLNQFLDFARGADAEDAVSLDLNEAAAEVVLAYGDGQFDLKTPAPILARAPAEGLKRALANLVLNALKYGKAPYAIETGVADGAPAIWVVDHGPGIPEAERERLLQPFARGNEARGGIGGSGLGLAIASRFAAARGGALSFETRADGAFAVTLALGPASWITTGG